MNRRSFLGLLGIAPVAISDIDPEYPVVTMRWTGAYTSEPPRFPIAFEPDISVTLDGRKVSEIAALETGRNGYIETYYKNAAGQLELDETGQGAKRVRRHGFVRVCYPDGKPSE